MKNWLTVKKACFTLTRLTVVGLMLWVGWGSVASVSSLFQQRPQSHPRAATPVSISNGLSADELTDFDREGIWVFAGIPVVLDLSGSIPRFEACVEDLVRRSNAETALGVIVDAEFHQLLKNAEFFGFTRTPQYSGTDLYCYHSVNISLAVCFKQHLGHLRLLGGVLLTTDTNTGTTRSYRALPSTSVVPAGGFLIPPEANPSRIATRFDSHGRPILEIALIPCSTSLPLTPTNKNYVTESTSAQHEVEYVQLQLSNHGTVLLAFRR